MTTDDEELVPVFIPALGPLLIRGEESLLDWMVNEDGVLHGGFSIRYYRATLPDEERQRYDEYIGVKEYESPGESDACDSGSK